MNVVITLMYVLQINAITISLKILIDLYLYFTIKTLTTAAFIFVLRKTLTMLTIHDCRNPRTMVTLVETGNVAAGCGVPLMAMDGHVTD